ncbi:MAG: hypothetical protein E6J90_36730 [Deltaproteobacteria bacterium]|nr:MAG: hypothetical protein E6J90_36730 [Deltaproteobacteria bacterium]
MTTSPAEQFVDLIRPRRRKPKKEGQEPPAPVENAEFLAMMWRMARALEFRAVEDPAIMIHVVALVQRYREIVNVAIAVNADRFKLDERMGVSQGESAALLGLTKQSVSERAKAGRDIIMTRNEQAGAVNFSEAKREREAIEAATEHAESHLGEYRARHLRLVS